jgi:hypothetical protein
MDVDSLVGAEMREVARRLARTAGREQRLGEIEARVAAAAFLAALGELFEVVEAGGRGGARERLVKIRLAQVHHAEHELSLRPGSARLLQQARGLLVAALLVELHRHVDDVVAGACPAHKTEAGETRGECSPKHHGAGSRSFATYTWSH